MELNELQAKMATAIANNDVKAIEEIAGAIVKGKADRHKVEAEALVKEAELLAKDREKLEKSIQEAVKTLNLDSSIAKLKAKGFTYTVDHREDSNGRIDANGEVKVSGGVGLLVTVIKARKAGGGGGSAGKTKDEYGMGLQEVFERFATADDKGKLADAEAKDKAASEKLGKSTNSNAWRVKNDVKKRAIADNLLAPVK